MKITFHRFNIGDVDDIDIYVAQPIYEWQQTEKGRWVMQHAHNVTYYRQLDANFWGHDVIIRGDLAPGPLLTEYLLKYHDDQLL